MRKSKLLVLTLCMMLSMLFLLGTECSATVYILNGSAYTVSATDPAGKAIKNPSSINKLTVYASGMPNPVNKSNKVVVYTNSNYTGTVVASRNFGGGESGARMSFSLPAGKTYYALISTTSTSSFGGKFTAYY